MKYVKKILLTLCILILLLLLGAGGFIGYLAATEFKPQPIETARIVQNVNKPEIELGKEFSALSYNIGYAGLGEKEDFFMDGGKMVRPDSAEQVHTNLQGIANELKHTPSDFYLLQEVDEDSKRSYNYNELDFLSKTLDIGYSFAYNFKCNYVPYPWPPIGRVASGLLTLTPYPIVDATRHALPVPFKWPVSMVNLKRCLLIDRFAISGSSKQLVVINLHLEAYDSGEGKIAQTKELRRVLEEEYKKGNYVIAGGDWNQALPGAPEFKLKNPDFWAPGKVSKEDLPANWTMAVDPKNFTCRLNDRPLVEDRENAQYYAIDGFLVSPNVNVTKVEVLQTQFKYSDHQPVRMLFKLKNQ